ncbi:carotenoid oxygenase family protein [Peterkaempfera sp. SMS 1(5)a]|uniref:carotenoid oxygenase family protein n=1 Tax=Peterkaempfera podocarpi TaxID=3232308 RepID=UPI0036735650
MPPGEAVFVPAAGARREGDGRLLSLVSDRSGGSARLRVLDAADLAVPAEVELPRRVPAGFHGSWIPESVSRRDGTDASSELLSG